jgi:hypothetical protein
MYLNRPRKGGGYAQRLDRGNERYWNRSSGSQMVAESSAFVHASENVNKQISTDGSRRNPHQIMTCSQLNSHALQKSPLLCSA